MKEATKMKKAEKYNTQRAKCYRESCRFPGGRDIETKT